MREDLVCIDERSKERDRKRQRMKQEERLGLRESQHARLGHSAVTRVGKIVLNQMPSLKVTLHRSLLRSLSPPAFFFSSFAPPPHPFFNPLPLSFSLLNHVFHPSFFSCSLDIDPAALPLTASVQPTAQGCVRFSCNNFTATSLFRTCYQYPYNGDRSITIQIYICVVPSNRHVKVHLVWIMKREELWSRYWLLG